MLYPEQVSPNVTYINNQYIDEVFCKISPQQQLDIKCHGDGIFEIDVLNQNLDFTSGIKQQFNLYGAQNQLYPVSVTGLKDVSGGVGSERFCTMSSSLAAWLTDVIAGKCLVDYVAQEPTVTKFHGSVRNEFSFLNVSQYFRFMKYTKGGEHFPHYDSDFEYNRGANIAVTKYSLVMYFTDCDTGEFAFVNDTRGETTDWNRQVTEDEIYLKIKPRRNKILLFPHTLCHTVLPFTDVDNERVIVRGDILFKKV